MTTPPAEVVIVADLVRGLLREQHPDLAGLPLRRATSGWDNEVWRLGDGLAVRLPRRALAADLLTTEQRWLPELARVLPVPVPAPVRVGRPGCGYPWSWSVVPWFEGRRASAAPSSGEALVPGLVGFLFALHRPTPPDAPVSPYRGTPLAGRDEVVRERLTRWAALEEAPRATVLATVWREALATPRWPGRPVWVHGDLHPANLLVDDAGALAAVLDFGDLTAGDPATDLAVAWMALDGPARACFRADLDGRGRDAAEPWACGSLFDATWRRARGWALHLGLILAALTDDAEHAAVGRRTLAALAGGD